MKLLSILLATTMIVQSAYGVSGLPLQGETSWEHLINRDLFHTNILRTKYSKNSATILISNLNEIEKNLIALDISTENDLIALEFLYNLGCEQLGIPYRLFTDKEELEILSFKEGAIAKVKEHKKYWTNYLNNHPDRPSKTLQIAKYISGATLVIAGIYAYKNQTTLKSKASELATKALASDFASKVKEVGQYVSTSFTELKTEAAKQLANASNYAINSQLYKTGSAGLKELSQVATKQYEKASNLLSIQFDPNFQIN